MTDWREIAKEFGIDVTTKATMQGYVLYGSGVKELKAMAEEIVRLRKQVDHLESGYIHTCHAKCNKVLCVRNRELDAERAYSESLEIRLSKYETVQKREGN